MKAILVTGGTGFIGSHTCTLLLEKNYQIFIIDSFCNSSKNSIEKVLEINRLKKNIKDKIHLYSGDIKEKNIIRKVFHDAKIQKIIIEGVIHFAGLKSVRESVLNPLLYWDNNVLGTINLINVMQENNCFSMVFSSSATIYTPKDGELINENSEMKPLNPYGTTKYTIENFLKDIFLSSPNKWRIACLRYFNPIGAHPSGLIGEFPSGIPNNIFPLILNTAKQIQKEIKVFGNDWPTRDGTPIRDYIHVMDLADGHIKVLEYLFSNKPNLLSINLGTGIGTTVLELIRTFENVNNVNVPFVYDSRREGDFGCLVADNSLAKDLLDWSPKYCIKDMCRDGWRWINLNPNGF